MELPQTVEEWAALGLRPGWSPEELADVATTLGSLAGTRLSSAIEGPRGRRRESDYAAQLIVVLPDVDLSVSLRMSHLVRNTIDPRTCYRAVAAAGGAAALADAGVQTWVAWSMALTSLISRPVSYAAACVLHKAWQITPFSHLVTLQALLAVASQITTEYGITKVSASDIQTYLDDLERAGALGPHPNGYKLQERVVMQAF